MLAALVLALAPQTLPPKALIKELWDKVTLEFEQDINSNETSGIFENRRLNVTFTHSVSGTVRKIPGYFAADGDAAETSATTGKTWRVHWAPEETGIWNWVAEFVAGARVAADPFVAGTPVDFDGYTGAITINATTKSLPDFRNRGLLQMDATTGALKFMGDSTFFFKVGAGSPENWLATGDFDNTPMVPAPLGNGTYRHSWSTHVASWRSADPTWQSTKGKGIIGSINYLVGYNEGSPPIIDTPRRGVNSIYVMLMNVAGDGQDVWPWEATTNTAIINNTSSEQTAYDCSKLDQWQIVFDYANEMGLHLTFYMGETENINLLGHMRTGLNLEDRRLIFYREMFARFGYLNAITWCITEEWPHSTGVSEQRISDVWSVWGEHGNGLNRPLDPYGHSVIVHLLAGASNAILTISHQVTRENFSGVGVQVTNYFNTTGGIRNNAHRLAEDWYDDQYDHGGIQKRPREVPWTRTLEEAGPTRLGIQRDGEGSPGDTGHQIDHLKQDLWVAACAGGRGHMSYLGCVAFNSPIPVNVDCDDVNLDDFEDWDLWWERTWLCLDMMNKNVPFQTMEYREDLRTGVGGLPDVEFHLMASYSTSGTADGEYYMCVFEEGVDFTVGGETATLDFEGFTLDTWDCYWFNAEEDNDGTLPGAGTRKTTVAWASPATLPTPPSTLPGDDETDCWVLFLDKQ